MGELLDDLVAGKLSQADYPNIAGTAPTPTSSTASVCTQCGLCTIKSLSDGSLHTHAPIAVCFPHCVCVHFPLFFFPVGIVRHHVHPAGPARPAGRGGAVLGRGTSRTNVLGGRGADGGSVLSGRGRGERPAWANRSSQMSLGTGGSGELPRMAKVCVAAWW